MKTIKSKYLNKDLVIAITKQIEYLIDECEDQTGFITRFDEYDVYMSNNDIIINWRVEGDAIEYAYIKGSFVLIDSFQFDEGDIEARNHIKILFESKKVL